MRPSFLRLPRIGITLLFIAAMILPVASCGNPSMPEDLKTRLEQAVDEAVAEYGIPGAMVGVWSPESGDVVILKGKADIEAGADMDSGDRVRICSITKTFTVTVVLELVDEGKLGLDDKLAEFYPDIPDADRITIRQLCDMTAGIFSYEGDETFIRTYTEDPDKVWEPEELVALAVAHPPYFPPGEGWHYSNTNSIILGMIIEERTGNDIASEIQSRLVDGLDLGYTYYPEGTDIEGVHVHGYIAGEGEELIDATYLFNPSGMGASGAMISTLDDLKAWVVALAKGDLLDQDTQAQRTSLVPGDYDYFGVPVQYGLGVLSCEGFLGHPGDGFGYTNAAFHSPETGTTIVVLLNKSPNDDAFMALTLFTQLAKIMNAEDSR
ncbi:MAG: beta-lactamase family protein [Actinobacteria bacterium]|nr:beta-lactamase family protein [Actinomycetota bacterium]